MRKAPFCAAIVVFLLFLAPGLSAYDIGVVLNQDAGVSVSKDETAGDYMATLVPRFSMKLDDTKDIFASAGLTFSYEYEEAVFAFELLRTEFDWVLGDLSLSIGRIVYADPLDFVVDGLFDGAQASYKMAQGTFTAGLWYTGLLYKKTNKIVMTGDDLFSFYYEKVDPKNVGETYFATRRLLMALRWEHPAIADLFSLKAALTGQFDVNDSKDLYHSQYATVKATMPYKQFVFDLGGCMELLQTPEAVNKNDEFGIAFAGEIGAAWAVPTPFQSQLSLNGLFTSGGTNGVISAFVPITTQDHGHVLKANISGLSIINLDFLARLRHTMSAGLSASLFLLSDLGTYGGYPLDFSGTNESHLLGTELFGQFIWSPVSDLQLRTGGGVFIPAYSDAGALWRIELSLLMALY